MEFGWLSGGHPRPAFAVGMRVRRPRPASAVGIRGSVRSGRPGLVFVELLDQAVQVRSGVLDRFPGDLQLPGLDQLQAVDVVLEQFQPHLFGGPALLLRHMLQRGGRGFVQRERVPRNTPAPTRPVREVPPRGSVRVRSPGALPPRPSRRTASPCWTAASSRTGSGSAPSRR